MKRLKPGLIILLCFALTVSSVFVGCKEEKEKETEDLSDSSEVTEKEEEKTAEYYIPEKKYDDEEFTVLCPTAETEWSCNDFYEETSSDEVIPNAVFERKSKVEADFGVKIKVVEGLARHQLHTSVMRAHDAGLIEYDLIMIPMPYAYTLAKGNYLMELYEMGDYIDFTHDAWDQSFLSQTSIAGYNYFATGEITTMDNDGTWVMMFNKELAESYDISPAEIYQCVIDGKWTLDKLLEYTTGFYTDVNNNGELDHEDKYGIASTIDIIQGLFYGANGRIVEKDRDDIPLLDFNNDYNSSLIDKIIKIYFPSNQITFDCHDFSFVDSQSHRISQVMFEENRALFYSEVMQCAIRLREMDTDFGIIPMPKYNKDQKEYTTHVVAATALMASFPKLLAANEQRRDFVAMITQALAVEGKNMLTPAYYEKSLMYKAARDDESRAMLPIIFENRICDLGYMMEGSGVATMYNGMITMIKSGSNTIASLNQSNNKVMASALRILVKEFEKNYE